MKLLDGLGHSTGGFQRGCEIEEAGKVAFGLCAVLGEDDVAEDGDEGGEGAEEDDPEGVLARFNMTPRDRRYLTRGYNKPAIPNTLL